MASPSSILGQIGLEQQKAIKAQIHEHLQNEGVFSSLKEIVSSVLGGSGGTLGRGSSDATLAAAQQKAVLAQMLAEQAGSRHSSSLGTAGDDHKQLLHVLFLGGRAFSHGAGEEGGAPDVSGAAVDGAGGQPSGRGAQGSSICACLHFGDQRFRTSAVPLCAEPPLRDGLLLELPPPDTEAAAAMASVALPTSVALERLRGLVRNGPQMHLLILRTDPDGTDTLLSSVIIEWRQVLQQGRHTLAVELPGIGAESTLPVGCMELKLELLPFPCAESRMSEAELMMALKAEREAQVEVERKFFAYARAWWSQFIDLSPAHQQRPVKLFALSELGTQRPVSAFVRPSRASRLIETPAQAAHFVSLLAHRRDPAAGSSVADVWRTTHSTLATRGGETEEHALLLCSLLLGFGLDAFVCVGTDARGPHVWVLTRDAYGTVTFWESLSAQQYTLGGADGHPYHTLACVFSHAAFLANIQPSTHLAHISLDLDDRQAWKAMDPKVLQSVTPLPTAPLRPSASLEHSTAEVAAEAALQRLVDEHRASLGLRAQGVQWDEQLGHLLSPALYSYESQAVTGNPVGPDLFADAIKRYVPHGHTFKGFPQHFSAADAAQMFASWMASPIARDIVETRTLRGTLAVRVRVFPLTDDVTSVWAMLAIAYRPEAQQ